MAVLLDRMPRGNHAVDMRSSLGGNGGIFRPQVQHNQPIQIESVLKARDRNLVAWAFSGTYDKDSPILVDAEQPSRSLSKRRAAELVGQLAGSFEAGTVVCVHSPNDILYPVLVLSALASECTWTGTNPASTSVELQHHLLKSKASYVITPFENISTVQAAISSCVQEIEIIILSDIVEDRSRDEAHKHNVGFRTLHDLMRNACSLPLETRLDKIVDAAPATIFSSSGTTGLPKMIQRTHRELVMESKATEDANSLKPYEVRRLYCTPMFHAFSFTDMVINTIRLGFPSFYMRRFDDTFAHKIHQFRITETLAAPPVLMRLVNQGETSLSERQKLWSLRTIICAGAPLLPELRSRFTRLFEHPVRLIQGWGTSEGGWFTTFRFPECDETGSVGRPVAGFEIRASETNAVQMEASRMAGELLAKAPQMPQGYMDNPQATAEAFTQDGWFRTGDIGYLEDGKVYLVDRAKDMIKVNGWSVAPAELEAALYKSPDVVDAAVVGDGEGVEEHPVIFIVAKEATVRPDQITDHLLGFVARFKVAKCEVKFISTIPRNASGKILRKVLRQQLQQ